MIAVKLYWSLMAYNSLDHDCNTMQRNGCSPVHYVCFILAPTAASAEQRSDVRRERQAKISFAAGVEMTPSQPVMHSSHVYIAASIIRFVHDPFPPPGHIKVVSELRK